HGLPTTSVMALTFQPRESDLIIGTHGRSIYIVDDVGPLRQLSAATLREPLHLYPVTDAQEHYNPSTRYRGGAGQFQGENEPYGALVTYSLNLPGLPLPDAEKERQRKAAERAAPKPQATEKNAEKSAERSSDKTEGEERAPRVDIVITDAAGKEVRRFKGPAKLGVNRAVWDFGSPPFKQPRERQPSPFRNEESGPEVAPGTYNVTVRFRGQEAKGTVKVLADPAAAELSADTWAARKDALERDRKLHAQTTEAIERVIAARKDVDLALSRLRQGDEGKDAKDGKDGGEAKEKEADKALVRAGEKLKKDLSVVEKKLWIPPGTKGIQRDKDLTSRLERLDESLTSAWSSPTPAQKAFLETTEAQAEAVATEVRQLFDSEVKAFRDQIDKAGIGLLLPPKEAPAP
ncbi:MAG TPA: hypothetical protein VMM92_14705, partial [Thermoanaerobaculia bacterium]|nr:hypothetical protein [Thermoanaerobaculia bacterium]